MVMKNYPLVFGLAFFLFGTSAFAQTEPSAHGSDDLLTDALNKVEAEGLLNRLDPEQHVSVTDIRVSNGQVLISLEQQSGAATVVYDPASDKVIHQENGSAK